MFRIIPLLAIFAVFLVSTVVVAIPTIQYSQGKYRFLNCRIDALSPEDCDPKGYDLLVLMHASPSLCVAAIVVLFTTLYYIGKYICNCCGGRRQSPNFCCPMKGVPAKYSKGDIMRPLILSAAVFVLSIVACIWGLTSLKSFDSHIKEMEKSMDLSVKQTSATSLEFLSSMSIIEYDVVGKTEKVVSLLDSLPDRDTFEKAFLNQSAMVYDVTKNIILKDLTRFKDLRILHYFIYILPTFFSAFGLAIALCNYRKYLSMTTFFFMALFAVLAWANNGVFASTSFSTATTCLEISEFTHRRVNVIEAISGCEDTVMQSHIAELEKVFLDRARIICDKIKPLCYNSSEIAENNVKLKQVFSCPLLMNCATATDDDLSLWVRTSMYTANEIIKDITANARAKNDGFLCALAAGQECDSKACSMECMIKDELSFVGRASKEFYTSVSSMVGARSALDSMGRQLGNCNAVLAAVIPPLVDPCNEAISAAAGMFQSSVLLSLVLIVAMFAYSIGAKRFIPLYKVQMRQSN